MLRRDFLLAGLQTGARVLDLGCGAGDFAHALGEAGMEVVGCDVSGVALRLARSRFPALAFVQSSEELPFDDDSFDVVWAGEVIEHVQDGLGLLAEIHRVLGRRGRLLASTPDHGALRRLRLGLSRRAFERNFDPRSDHVRFFTAATLRAILAFSAFGEVEVASRHHVLLATATSV